ncbi:ribosome-associated ATPase/putative transporter RbbA [Xanthobacter tagetidis]|uniref:ABC transporter ATP-binding protein/permease n=1 Tax=Xanthobacter tagetidis TaxID=60216 RepID=A0A3L7A1M7_9HYPH|nr:ribosome-associated ATPase/putative transporter RbbA [Xanthobacter tagetidis]MBB6307083.1 ribosome-dependent ATPase [Xanthobacter tagetidis]RLP73272.1 ABC transporter ATP-binding protein/permease [Xanthobacter tagetidis]
MSGTAGAGPGGPADAIRLTGIRHAYGRTLAVDGIDLLVAEGASVALVGPDGVGKSTLFGLIAGAKRIQAGKVEVLGADFSARAAREAVQPRIAFMPQGLGRNLYPNLTVAENIAFFARLFGEEADAKGARVAPLLAATGLDPFADRLMRKLSGGMKQKLGLCCALVHDPDLLLLDEPTTGVDPLSRRQFWDFVEQIRADRPRLTLLVATADMEEAARFERVVMVDGGRILADGTPADLLARTGQPNLERAFISLLPEGRRGDGPEAAPAAPIADDAPIAIESRGLTRRFGDFVAVDHVSFKIRRGEIFGFLGSNGCGKSTTMKMLTGLLPASSGEALLFGVPVDPADIETRRRVGYMSQAFSLYGELTVRQNLELHARLFTLAEADGVARIAELVRDFDLAGHLDALSDGLPLGVRQRLSLAVAVLHRPEVLILDEPTSGVDPVARDNFWDHLQRLSRTEGVTIFVSTHFMGEAERCDRISFMHAGKVIATGTPEALKREKGTPTLEEAFIAYMEMGGRAAETKARLAPPTPHAAGRPAAFSPRRLGAYAWREALELRRDPVRLAFALLGTALLMVIFGYGITLDVDKLRFAVLDRDQTPESRAYVDGFAHSTYFVMEPALASPDDLDRRLKANSIAFAIEIPPEFGADLRSGRPTEILVTIDGAMPFRAETIQGYVQAVHLMFLADAARMAGRDVTSFATLEMRYRYNQAFKSVEAMVPATIALMLIFIPAILTALGVVTEKELGSITNLYVTPVTKLEFLLGKQLPYAAVAFFNFGVLVLMALFLFGVPLKGSFLGLALGAAAYVLATTAIGLVSSTLTNTQVAALFGTAIGTMMPATQFSGMLQPVATLEGGAWVLGTFFPTTYFMRISVGAFTKGLDLADLLPFVGATILFWPALLALAWVILRKQEV